MMKISKGTKQTLKRVIGVVAFVLLAVFLAAACTQGFTNGNPWGWFDKDEQKNAAMGGAIAAPVEDDVKTLGISVRRLSGEEYSDYDIMPTADSGFTIKANYTDQSVTYKELDWTIQWKSGASGQWGNGKTLSEYATISPSQDTLTLTVTVKKAFGEQIIITATNRVNPEVTKSATLDYAKRVEYGFVSFTGKNGEFIHSGTSSFSAPGTVANGTGTETMTSVEPAFTYSNVYTVEDTFTISKLEISVNQTFVTDFKRVATASPLYTGGVKTVIDAIDTTGKKVTVTNAVPDFSVFQVIWKQLAGDAYTSSTSLDSNLKQLCALYMKSGPDTFRIAAFNYHVTAQGTYSTVNWDSTAVVTGIGFSLNFFGVTAASGSLTFDREAIVA